MVIVGAKGLAKEVVEIFSKLNRLDGLYFFDNINKEPHVVFDRFPILHTLEDVKSIFHELQDSDFVLGLGGPLLRYRLAQAFEQAGGTLRSAIHPASEIGTFGTRIDDGVVILAGTTITNGVTIGRGSLINPNCTLSHDASVGAFVEISPGVRITGHCKVGDFCMLGTNASILPKVQLGRNVIVGAGAVVTRDVPDNSLVAGVPAIVKRKLDPITL